ncbi:hypothetical protein D3Y57_00650 (plasmid) [Sphingomonas paeninsulae]|uniref:Uncharacterized protein n=1 Tax=Sphingomonas paeninsulae TaxID=2319844 RepID=A0A494TFH2_SPHPE|nr:hypothetical protein D3Y57_00650 [Sphingomonas paeninsulae]
MPMEAPSATRNTRDRALQLAASLSTMRIEE